MSSYVYFLISKNKDNWSYVGCTSNLKQRIKDHNNGKTRSTKAYRPLMLVYKEKFDNISDARKRELFYKSGYGREERYNILKSNYSEIV